MCIEHVLFLYTESFFGVIEREKMCFRREKKYATGL